MEQISRIFNEPEIANKIKRKLPQIFQTAEIESSRAGKIGMEVGTIRERIIVALLLHAYGKKAVDTDIPTTESEIDVRLYDVPFSIKTFTAKKWSSLKLIWTVDPTQALHFQRNYKPSCGMLLVHINWGGVGGLYYFTQRAQLEILQKMGRERYIKLPKVGTNPRGVEISADALTSLSLEKDTLKLQINWRKSNVDVDTFKRWVELWEED
jgi:hypothetical protein